MTVLEWRAQQIIRRLEEEWKVVTLSYEATQRIDHQLAMALKPIKEEFAGKESRSRTHIAEIEETSFESIVILPS